jgi:hypothetical protein
VTELGAFQRVFFESGLEADQDSGFYPVAIDGREYVVDLTTNRYIRASVEVAKTRQNRVPNENLLLEPEVWRTLFESWHLGTGQTRKDREESQFARGFRSHKINPWQKWGIELHHDTELLHTASVNNPWVLSVVDAVVIVGGTQVAWFTDLDGGAQTGTLPSPAVDVTTDGEQVYVLSQNGSIYSIDVTTWGGSSPTLYNSVTGTPTMLANVKGLLLAGAGRKLFDVSNTSLGALEVYEHPVQGHTWIDGTDGLSAGYLIGGQGDKWHIYWITVKDDASTFNPPVVATPLPEGEVGKSLGSYLGFVLVGTDKGVRFCTPGGDNSLTYGKLIYTGANVLGFEGQDRFVWFGIGNRSRSTEHPLQQPEAGLARMDLSEFTAPLTPAYASDLVASTGTDVGGRGGRVTTYQDRRVFAIDDGRVFKELDTYVPDGWWEEGTLGMGVEDAKVSLYLAINCAPLVGSIAVDFSADRDEQYEQVLYLDTPNAITSNNVGVEQIFEKLQVRYRLSSTITDTPRLTRFAFRTVGQVGAATEWRIPILIADAINWESIERQRDMAGDLAHLIGLTQSGRTFTLREGGDTYRCFSPGYEFLATSMAMGRRGFQGVVLFQCRAIR